MKKKKKKKDIPVTISDVWYIILCLSCYSKRTYYHPKSILHFNIYFLFLSPFPFSVLSILSKSLGEPAVARENNCLNAAKACNLNDTCKKYRSAYISPCTSRVSSAEVCNKRKCHKALRQFFDKASHS